MTDADVAKFKKKLDGRSLAWFHKNHIGKKKMSLNAFYQQLNRAKAPSEFVEKRIKKYMES